MQLSSTNRSRVSLRSTFRNCHFLFGHLQFYLRIVAIAQLSHSEHAMHRVTYSAMLKSAMRVIKTDLHDNKRCWYQLDRNCDQQTSTTTNVLDETAFLRQRTAVDADHRGGWTQIFGSKASELMTSWPVQIRKTFYQPLLHLAPQLGRSHRSFIQIFCIIKLDSLCVRRCLRDPICLAVFGRTPTCDRWTRDDSKYGTSAGNKKLRTTRYVS